MTDADWIPVEERMPPFKTPVLITEVDGRSHKLFTTVGQYMMGGWFVDGLHAEVIAWAPMPHPYGRMIQEEYDEIGEALRTKNFIDNPDFPNSN